MHKGIKRMRGTIDTHTHTHIHTHTYTYTHIYTHIHTYTHIDTHIDTHRHTYTHTHTHTDRRVKSSCVPFRVTSVVVTHDGHFVDGSTGRKVSLQFARCGLILHLTNIAATRVTPLVMNERVSECVCECVSECVRECMSE